MSTPTEHRKRITIAAGAALLLAAGAAAALVLHAPPPRAMQAMDGAQRSAAAPTEAVPGLVWQSGGATLRLGRQPCPSPELASALEYEGVGKPRVYEVVQGAKRFTGCWSVDVAGDVVTLEPGRELGSIPLAWFRAGT